MNFYSHDFRRQGFGDWVIQANASAPSKLSEQFGFGITVEQPGQWTEIISGEAIVGPNSTVKALMYVPIAAGNSGLVANWPALWTSGPVWPDDGEIDILEGQHGYAALQTHWGVKGVERNSESNDAPLFTGGWLAIEMHRSDNYVTATYSETDGSGRIARLGPVPMPANADHNLRFQNQYRWGDTINNGPFEAATAWLARISVVNG